MQLLADARALIIIRNYPEHDLYSHNEIGLFARIKERNGRLMVQYCITSAIYIYVTTNICIGLPRERRSASINKISLVIRDDEKCCQRSL